MKTFYNHFFTFSLSTIVFYTLTRHEIDVLIISDIQQHILQYYYIDMILNKNLFKEIHEFIIIIIII